MTEPVPREFRPPQPLLPEPTPPAPRPGNFARTAGFIGAGAVAFGVDQLVLQGLTLAGMKPEWARIGSILVAIVIAWRLNRRVFSACKRAGLVSQAAEFIRYFFSALTARALDYGVFVLALPLLSTHLAGRVGPQPVYALAAAGGALAGGVLGYVLFERLVFPSQAAKRTGDRRAT